MQILWSSGSFERLTFLLAAALSGEDESFLDGCRQVTDPFIAVVWSSQHSTPLNIVEVGCTVLSQADERCSR
jgi:hypothetical protein